MSHKAQIDFCNKVKRTFPYYFKGKFVLDCGSLDINGNNRYLFDNCDYVGVDVCTGNNVDIVKPVHELEYPDGFFDTILSTEMLEHDKYYAESFQSMVRMLKPKGLLFFTCATNGRRVHGTAKRKPEDSPTHKINGWENYYKNLTENDFKSILKFSDVFLKFDFEIEPNHHDLYFWGIKK